MSVPEIHELEEAAKKIVHHAMRAGTASSLTPRIVRQELEKTLSLKQGSLDDKKYKDPLKAAIKRAADSPKATATTRLKKKRTSDEGPSKSPSTSRTKKAKEAVVKSDKKSISRRKVQKKDTKEYKSAEHVPTSDVEMDEPKSEKEDDAVVESKDDRADTTPRKRRKVVASDSEEDEEQEPKPRTEVKPASKAKSKDEDEVIKSESDSHDSDPPSKDRGKGKQKTKAKVEEDADKSESELSVLIDEPPKRKRKAKETKEPKKTSKKSKAGTKGSAGLSKEEETIKRLKSLVVACGVRKVWSKVFQGIGSPQQQIKKLREILADLGMSGRMSIEQAKAIKEKRELAKELEEVQQFEKSVVGASKRGSKAAEKESSSDSENASESETETEAIPRKRARNARQSIMAFLQDQSDDSD
ncbi:hypothetical protein BDQ17DRAFT_1362795 [Cyathus striatus]|nr:hypothetical protein BDQ17DRAFT_1362795 [Cyathus striatus]